jgi:hypothetical protein
MTYWPADNPGGRRRQIGLADGACAILTCGPQFLCSKKRPSTFERAANAVRRTKTVFRAKYDSLVIRRGHKKTIIALAHKLIRTIYVIMVRRVLYRDHTVDYEAPALPRTPRGGSAPSRNTGGSLGIAFLAALIPHRHRHQCRIKLGPSRTSGRPTPR